MALPFGASSFLSNFWLPKCNFKNHQLPFASPGSSSLSRAVLGIASSEKVQASIRRSDTGPTHSFHVGGSCVLRALPEAALSRRPLRPGLGCWDLTTGRSILRSSGPRSVARGTWSVGETAAAAGLQQTSLAWPWPCSIVCCAFSPRAARSHGCFRRPGRGGCHGGLPARAAAQQSGVE